jgi:activator of 2-hydroxyglutaryl-CoA dehydratase
MTTDLLMGIDVGTYETKGVLVTPEGNCGGGPRSCPTR